MTIDCNNQFWRRFLEVLFWLCLLGLLTRMANAGSPNPPSSAGTRESSLQDNLAATCRITYSPRPGTQSQHVGTGVALARGDGAIKVLTAAHVVDEVGATVSLVFWKAGQPREPVEGHVEWASYVPGTARDVAIVSVPLSALGGDVPHTAGMSPRDIRLAIGDPVASAGCAHGNWPTLFVGHVVAELGAAVEFEPAPAEGRSGSALFDLATGQVVGLVDWQTADRRRGRAMSVAELYRAFDGLEPGPVIETAADSPSLRLIKPRCEACGYRHDPSQTQCGPDGCRLPDRGTATEPWSGRGMLFGRKPQAEPPSIAPPAPSAPAKRLDLPEHPQSVPYMDEGWMPEWLAWMKDTGLAVIAFGLPARWAWLAGVAFRVWWSKRGEERLKALAKALGDRLAERLKPPADEPGESDAE